MDDQPKAHEPLQGELWPATKLNHLGMTFGDEPVATFQYLLNDEWFETLYLRQFRAAMPASNPRSPHYIWLTVIYLFIVAVFIWLTGLSPFNPWVIAGALGIPLSLFALSKYSRLQMVRSFRQSKSYTKSATAIVYREGIVFQDRYSCSAISWEDFVWAARFHDGFLLRRTTLVYWVPIAGLTAGRVEDIVAVLQARIADYKVIRDY